MTLDTILAFLFGALVGFLLAAYVLHRPEQDKHQTTFDTEQMQQLMQQQVAFIQTQNMLRGLQIEQAKQEQEFRALERSRTVYLAGLNHD